MRVAIISTYPPRACGIATFSRDLLQALRDADPSVTVGVVPIVRDRRSPPAAEVLHVIRQDVRADYTTAAAAIDAWGADAVLIEHEYGIFGGECGSHVLTLARHLRQPFVVTLHTVLSRASDEQTHVVTELCRKAAAVTVFTDTARRMVLNSGVASRTQVRVVPHGAPMSLIPAGDDTGIREFPQPVSSAVVDQLRDRIVLSTFGLLSAGKGVETAIEALPAVVAQHPNLVYLVAGQTHPDVVTREGERYRLHLERLVRDRLLERHVHFIDRFLSEYELAELLASTDLFLTPYRSREQIVSGALTFAIAAGCPVVSTPYYYAEDLLATGAGAVVPFDDAATMSDAILQFLNSPADRAKAAAEARRIGAALTWPAVAAQIIELLDNVVGTKPAPSSHPRDAAVASSPPVRTDHLLSLIDDTGKQARA